MKQHAQNPSTLSSRPVPSSVPGGQISPPGASNNKWAILIVAAIGTFMATLDSSIVNISLPSIAHEFGVPLSGEVEWVVIAYLVATAAIMLTAGRLADMLGKKVIWVSGLIIFTVSSACCGLAPTLPILIIARAVQGIGGALTMAVGPAMITGAFPTHERGRALGLNAITVSLGISVGPVLGGFLTGALSWRWIFFVNLPMGIIGLIATFIVLKGGIQHNEAHFDPLGALLLAIGLACITAALSFGVELGWLSPLILTLLSIGILSLLALPYVEMHVGTPVIVLSLLKNRVFTSSILSLLLGTLALFAVGFMMPFYLEELRGFSTQLSGLLLTPMPLAIAFIAPFSGALADRIGTRWLAAGGLTICCIGLVLVSFLNAHSSIFDIVWRLFLIGVGQAIFQSPNNSALLGAAPREHQGSASGFLATSRTIGQSVSIALAGAVFTSLGGATAGAILSSGKSGIQTAALQQTFVNSFHAAFLTCAGVAAIGILTSLVRGKEVRHSTQKAEAAITR
ncbi:MFS transporter [Dictyobacter arantiisoli]|uniref:MFS transporter n=1 Tax=Dictyobacter arantiisoli TaxID=2014874 RepID=A0A5A5TCQ0_9CHLR|nr:MFS transporter [Dictyobacter arantiisoli]GCF08714.1 MFS transporter [Dictyobacter arantiisoli]